MSDADIYKSREQAQVPSVESRKRSGRRRRTSNHRVFDQHDRSKSRRRSKNSGFRRVLHLSRKSENEKIFWWSLAVSVVVLLVVVAIWQFWYLDYAARNKSDVDQYGLPRDGAPQSQSVDESAAE